MKQPRQLWLEQGGQDIAEYAVILANDPCLRGRYSSTRRIGR
jgi:hypothetical protein